MEPRRIASYTLLEPIGHGGMAAVYRARQEMLDRTVAIKLLAEHLATSDEFMQRFVREARTAASMRHPNVITVYDFGQDERGVPYLVLEYVDGPTLADLLDEGLDDSRIPDLVDQIAAGLDYAHSRGVIHRDVKPGNVLLTRDGRVVLADFGLASLLESAAHLTVSGGVIGTPEYMSPEQASGLRADARSDVYGLGVVLYEMLTGERPFSGDGENPMATLLKHVRAPVPALAARRPDLPAAVEAVLQQALAKDPEHRFQTAGALARAFREALVGSRDASGCAPHRPALNLAPPSLTPAAAALGAEGATSPRTEEDGRPCPGCGATMPAEAGICPTCMYMIPLDQLPKRADRPKKIQRREVVVNLLPYQLRWNPAGLEAARKIAAEALTQATQDGWEPASIGEPCRLVEGKTLGGPIVRSAVLSLERLG